jgi:NADPH:quinone reductase-like Zn-dependent oxidoreductase
LALLSQLFDAGKLQAVIDKTFDFKDMQAAHAYVDSGRKKGNVVVRVG